jgi:sialate O-acetylesterase
MQWHEGDFPFLFVQLANFNADATWPVVREAQRRTLKLANTGMAVTIDIGDATNIHPADKQDVGARLALAARQIAYGEKIDYSGPMFREMTSGADSARVWFDHAHGLIARGGELMGFEIAAADRKFFPAQARIDGETVVLTSSQVAGPKYVRYGWAANPTVNLYNAANLPAAPFTSEDVPQ